MRVSGEPRYTENKDMDREEGDQGKLSHKKTPERKPSRVRVEPNVSLDLS